MCSYIVEKATLYGSAKGANGWMKIDTANVYYDHPFHTPLDHALMVDFVNEAEGAKERIVPVGRKALEAIAYYRGLLLEETGFENQANGPLFLNHQGARLTTHRPGSSF